MLGNETQKIGKFNFIIWADEVRFKLIRYFIMMGISTNPSSILSVTDNPKNEKSNINR